LVQTQDANLIVKSKSMMTKEINLNQAFEGVGIEVVETDLGEYIVQLRKEPPSHIVAPAIHLRREDVGQTFHKKLGMPYTDNIETMNKTARDSLREKFLSADVGVSGVNFGVAETGTICIVTNEGNGRMVTTIPRMHIAIMGIERLVPTLEDLDIMLRLLPRFATGQKLTSYVSLIQGPRGPLDPDGPNERHLILVDNGRHAMRGTAIEEALLCIRCGSCLDFCPVYREIGGYSYDSVYTGPIGSVISPGLFGLEEHGHLAKASTLCAACKDACPVDIDLPKLLLRVRENYSQEVPQPSTSTLGVRLYSWIMDQPARLGIGQKLASWGTRILPKRSGWGKWLPSPLSAWTKTRDFPPFAGVPFRNRFPHIDQTKVTLGVNRTSSTTVAVDPPQTKLNPIEGFLHELEALQVETVRCSSEELAEKLLKLVLGLDQQRVLAWGLTGGIADRLGRTFSENGIELIEPYVDQIEASDRQATIDSLGKVRIGLTVALAGFANTGTLVLPSGQGQSQLASLLPSIHLAILHAEKIFPSMSAWIDAGGKSSLQNSQSVSLVTGPSRTADIEMTLSIGVHGPGRVVVFLVE
jgi:L-lactate dehydrogenase complex protein LldF